MEELKLSQIATKNELLADVNEAIATLLANIENFPCIEDVTRISQPLQEVRILLMQ